MSTLKALGTDDGFRWLDGSLWKDDIKWRPDGYTLGARDDASTVLACDEGIPDTASLKPTTASAEPSTVLVCDYHRANGYLSEAASAVEYDFEAFESSEPPECEYQYSINDGLDTEPCGYAAMCELTVEGLDGLSEASDDDSGTTPEQSILA